MTIFLNIDSRTALIEILQDMFKLWQRRPFDDDGIFETTPKNIRHLKHIFQYDKQNNPKQCVLRWRGYKKGTKISWWLTYWKSYCKHLKWWKEWQFEPFVPLVRYICTEHCLSSFPARLLKQKVYKYMEGYDNFQLDSCPA